MILKLLFSIIFVMIILYKIQIQELIDDALDAGDFDTVAKLSKYL